MNARPVRLDTRGEIFCMALQSMHGCLLTPGELKRALCAWIVVHPQQERMDVDLFPHARPVEWIGPVEVDDLLLVLRTHKEQAADHARAIVGHQRPAHHAPDLRGCQVGAMCVVAVEPALQRIGVVKAMNDEVHIPYTY
ncbi:hypothetical protein CT19431_160152 [Cupriavidus taiwanensis]|nr:hypothetical protein CT19431_160152 [Cupriavidus taiwanensis]